MEEISREYKDQAYQMLAKVGKAVSSPKRLEILDILMQGAKTVEAVAKAADMSIANTSQHLQTLLEARLVVYRKQGLYSFYQLADQTVADFNRSLQSLAEARMIEIRSFREALYRNRDNMEKIEMDELLARMKRDDVTLIDVRPRDEYEALHIPGANSIPLVELEKHLALFPPGKEIVAYCRGKYCMLSVEAVELLRTHGFRATRMEESVQEWYAQAR
jgi:rhodanese-related sulfurtransferase